MHTICDDTKLYRIIIYRQMVRLCVTATSSIHRIHCDLSTDLYSLSPRMMEYSLDGHNVSLSAIRTVRVLRPLRAINRVPSKYNIIDRSS